MSSIKFDNHVYYYVCELTLRLFKGSDYATYYNYCNTFKTSIIQNKFSIYEEICIIKISKELELIYALNEVEAGEYISNYFLLDKFSMFERTVRQMNELFPNSYLY